ncbi:MAG: hypothetical protein P8J68_03130 [Arenicellaceae bacterium]|nr:hypothetical protein [Arenicellaceae bacterium]
MEYIFTNVPHWHILLNHFPSIGFVIVIGLYLTSLYLKSEDLNRASLILFVVLGLLAIPTYLTGLATNWVVLNTTEISADLITVHQDAALITFIGLSTTSFLSWLALWQYRRFSQPTALIKWGVLVVAVISIVTLLETGSRGGDIYPVIPIDAGVDIAAQASSGATESLKAYIFNSPWIWPAMEATHFIGMALLFGVVLFVALRVLGVAKIIPFQAVHRLLPLGVLGLVVNVVTGMAFLIADSQRYTAIPAFYWKLALITIGGIAALYFTIFSHPWSLKAGDNASPIAKVMAAVTILGWAAVLLLGRMLPYLEGV